MVPRVPTSSALRTTHEFRQEHTSSDNPNRAVLAETQQILISGNDRVRADRDDGGDDVIVVWVTADRTYVGHWARID
jgi:hypothetical protein